MHNNDLPILTIDGNSRFDRPLSSDQFSLAPHLQHGQLGMDMGMGVEWCKRGSVEAPAHLEKSTWLRLSASGTIVHDIYLTYTLVLPLLSCFPPALLLLSPPLPFLFACD